ncbi:MAG: GNAT family N-acetyltransferase [Bacteroidia bacterium]|nr:GNAT family N-acetyltransferase [Bacteroidia bacterium]
MEIRKATPSDTETIAALAEKIWMQYYPEIITVEQIRYMLDKMYSAPALQQQMSEGQDFYLLLENEQPIGYCSFSTTEPGHYFLHKFYVDTHYHGKGIGTFLLNEMLKQLAPVLTVRLTVNRKNYRSINFYFKNGFTIEKIADFDIGNNYFMNDFIMLLKPTP